MTLGDRIAVLRDGRVEQVAPPLDVYARPASVFVADFIGTPRMNWFAGRLARYSGRLVARFDGFRVDVPGLASEAAREGREITLGVRPQDLRPTPPDDADVRGRVELREALGSTIQWENEAMKAKSIETGELWEMQWYPDTPVSFYCVAAPTLADLLRYAMEENTK